MSTQVFAPLAGQVLSLAEGPDPVFAEALVGPGLAIDPAREPNEVVSRAAARR